MSEVKKYFCTEREKTTGSVNAVVRLTRSSFHGANDKIIKQFT
jgi:hypothetical protein